jgi:chromosome segregation ATPase
METLWEAVEEENTSVSKELRERDSEVEVLQRERGELTVRVERQHKRLESAASQLTDMETSLLSCQDDLEAAEIQVNALEGQVYGFETKIKDAEEDKQRLSEIYQLLRDQASTEQDAVSRSLSLPKEETSREVAVSSQNQTGAGTMPKRSEVGYS